MSKLIVALIAAACAATAVGPSPRSAPAARPEGDDAAAGRGTRRCPARRACRRTRDGRARRRK